MNSWQNTEFNINLFQTFLFYFSYSTKLKTKFKIHFFFSTLVSINHQILSRGANYRNHFRVQKPLLFLYHKYHNNMPNLSVQMKVASLFTKILFFVISQQKYSQKNLNSQVQNYKDSPQDSSKDIKSYSSSAKVLLDSVIKMLPETTNIKFADFQQSFQEHFILSEKIVQSNSSHEKKPNSSQTNSPSSYFQNIVIVNYPEQSKAKFTKDQIYQVILSKQDELFAKLTPPPLSVAIPKSHYITILRVIREIYSTYKGNSLFLVSLIYRIKKCSSISEKELFYVLRHILQYGQCLQNPQLNKKGIILKINTNLIKQYEEYVSKLQVDIMIVKQQQ